MAAPPPQQGQGDNSLAPLWMMVGLFVVGGLVWYFLKEQIVFGFFKIKLLEIDAVSLFTNKLASAKAWILKTPIQDVVFDDLTKVSVAVGEYVRYPVMVILGILGVIMLFFSVELRFRSTYTMKRLVDTEKGNWPQIAPVASLDLTKQDIDKGPWAMSLQPMQFAKKNKLLREERKPVTEGMLAKQTRVTVSLISGAAHRVFSLQLGKFFQGVDKLSPASQALFAVFAAKANADDKAARKLLSQISASTETGKLNFEGTQALLKKYGGTPLVQEVLKRHAYELTVMASMLETSRLDGVLASAEFLWLKPVDRPLWYMLNTVGRPTAVPEVAGAVAHWLAERELGKKILVPMVEEAVKALDAAIKEVIYNPDIEEV